VVFDATDVRGLDVFQPNADPVTLIDGPAFVAADG
jgi:hypothetical protein